MTDHPSRSEPPDADQPKETPPHPFIGWELAHSAPRDGTPFRAYAPWLVDEDFNPTGTIEAVFDGNDGFVGAIWDGQQDCWNTEPVTFSLWQHLSAPTAEGHLGTSDAPPHQQPKCIIGEYCHRHGFIHGAEAEELREHLEAYIREQPDARVRDLQAVLDAVDARDSLAFQEVGEVGESPASAPRLADAAEMLWVVLAHVSGGDWTQQTPDWQEAAVRWRDNYFAALKATPASVGAVGANPQEPKQ